MEWRNQPPKEVKLPEWAKASCRYSVLKLGKPPQSWHLIMDSGAIVGWWSTSTGTMT
jgi:hypothetical protein